MIAKMLSASGRCFSAPRANWRLSPQTLLIARIIALPPFPASGSASEIHSAKLAWNVRVCVESDTNPDSELVPVRVRAS